MDVEQYVEFTVGLASGEQELPDDVEDQVAAMGLEPTLRDRTLLLIEQTRMLAERATGQSAGSARLRSSAEPAGDTAATDDRRAAAADRRRRLARGQAVADARDDLLARREETADARDDTLRWRETATDAREQRVDDREEIVDLTKEQLQRREEDLDVRAAALDELATARLSQLLSAIDRGMQTAQRSVDPVEALVAFEDEVRDAVTAELEQAVPELVEQAMHRWVDHAHHELRQPLAVISGVAETLALHDDRLDEAARSTLVLRLRRQSLLLQRIIDQLARATLLRSGPPDVTPQQLDLRPLIQQLRDDYGPLLEGADVTFDQPDDTVLACVEPAAATEILLVLLRNAIDHAPCDEPILIELVPSAATVRVSVHDDGPGVPAADRASIFNYGTRLNHAGSLGLGLFIARQLSQALGGKLTVDDSERVGGARFDLTLPVECPPAADDQP